MIYWLWLIVKIAGAGSLAMLLLFCLTAMQIAGRESDQEQLLGEDECMANEKKVKQKIKSLLESRGWYTWAVPQNAFGTGVSDRNAIRSGVFLAVEAKSGTRKLTANQARYLEAINAEDAFGFVVSEKTLAAFETWLDTFDRMAKATSKGQKPAPEDGAANLEAIRLLTEPLVEAIHRSDFAATGGKIAAA